MAKDKTVYVCNQCGAESPKWIGKCPACGAWNTYVEQIVRKEPSVRQYAGGLDREKKYPVVILLEKSARQLEQLMDTQEKITSKMDMDIRRLIQMTG